MLTILHGNNVVQSREKMVEMVAAAKTKSYEVIRLAAKHLTPAILEEKLGTGQLFGATKLVIVEQLHSQPRSKKQTQLIKLLAGSTEEVVLWEKRQLTPTMLKKFPQAKKLHFKLSSSLFAWLDSLNPNDKSKPRQLKLIKKAIADDGAQACLVMLMRQIRLLITAKDGGLIKGPPFVASKIKQQAAGLTMKQLLSTHSQLLAIDQANKTSRNILSIEQALDLLILSL